MCSVEHDHSVGKGIRLAFGIARLHMIVSCTEFNSTPDLGAVWVVPVTRTGRIEARLLGHAAHGTFWPADNVPVPDDDIVSWAVQYVKWGINGREPPPDSPDAQRELHQQAISAGSSFGQWDLVVYGSVPYILVSGLAFNTLPHNDVVWGVPIMGTDNIMHAELISALPKERIRSTGRKVVEEDITNLHGQLNLIIGGIPPDWPPEPAAPEPSGPGPG